jgi:CubicO group peptidase (beta-lactamase class C family)
MRISIGFMAIFFALLFFLASCLEEGEIKTEMNYEPKSINDGWALSSPEEAGFNPDLLKDVYEMMFSRDRFITSRSLLIVKDGKLVSESYFNNVNDIERKNGVQGITKSVTSLLTGMAIDNGHFKLDDTLYNIIPGYFDGDRDKRVITVEHLLTMTSGLEWDNEKYTINLFNSSRFPSSMRIVLSKSMTSSAGTEFYYNHGTPQLVTGLIGITRGGGNTDSIVNAFFSQIGITDFVWEKHDDGLHIGGMGLHLKPRDIARIGQFCLQKGIWNDSRVLSEDWITVSTKPKISPDQTATDMHYGYYWWIDDENNAFFGMGEGGQYLYIVPDKELVIVHTASSSVGEGYEGVTLGDFLSVVEMILGAMI